MAEVMATYSVRGYFTEMAERCSDCGDRCIHCLHLRCLSNQNHGFQEVLNDLRMSITWNEPILCYQWNWITQVFWISCCPQKYIMRVSFYIVESELNRSYGVLLPTLNLYTTVIGCYSLVVVLSLSKREVLNSSPARTGRVKPEMFKIGSDCSFVKSTTFRSENHGSFGYDLKNGGPVSQ
jgi:hypothetical protein